MESREIAALAYDALDDKKGIDITVLDISEISVMADYFIIASGNSSSQVQALIDNVDDTLGRNGITAKQVEGYRSANWVLMDYGDVIIHVFDKDNRLFYDLEKIWKDGKLIDRTDLN